MAIISSHVSLFSSFRISISDRLKPLEALVFLCYISELLPQSLGSPFPFEIYDTYIKIYYCTHVLYKKAIHVLNHPGQEIGY